MITLIRRFFHDLLYSPERVQVWGRTLAMWLAQVAGYVIVDLDRALTWTVAQWRARILVGLIVSLPLLIKAGQKNSAEATAAAAPPPAPPAAPPAPPPAAPVPPAAPQA